MKKRLFLQDVYMYTYGYSIFKSSLSDIPNLVGVCVYIYIYICVCTYKYHARRDAAAGWRPRSPPFVGRFHTMDLDSFRKGIKEEFFQSSSSFQAHIQHKALDTGTLMDSPALRALCVFMHYKLARTHRCSACKSRCILTFDSG